MTCWTLFNPDNDSDQNAVASENEDIEIGQMHAGSTNCMLIVASEIEKFFKKNGFSEKFYFHSGNCPKIFLSEHIKVSNFKTLEEATHSSQYVLVVVNRATHAPRDLTADNIGSTCYLVKWDGNKFHNIHAQLTGGHEGKIHATAFCKYVSNDEPGLVVTGGNRIAVVWSTKQGDMLMRLCQGHSQFVTCVDFINFEPKKLKKIRKTIN